MPYEHLRIEREGAIACVIIDRPKKLNALNSAVMDELHAAMLELQRDEAVRSVVVTGAGDKSFVAGADIEELAEQTPVRGREHARRGQRVFDLVEQLGKPVVAAVNGFALGGGCELAMACTLRIAADTARFGQPEINLGLIPGYAGTQRLSRLVGRGRALELVLTGRMIQADEALAIGLVHRVVPAASLREEAHGLATELAAKAPVAMRYAIEAIQRGAELSFDDACALEATLFGVVASTDDMREGTRAFLEKRKPSFTGR